ncbi:MAG: hypothetical protein HFH82_00660 [Lachnospiraceae bacterium]|nr:hypothetical protein [Lachnospiraceae bacterium]
MRKRYVYIPNKILFRLPEAESIFPAPCRDDMIWLSAFPFIGMHCFFIHSDNSFMAKSPFSFIVTEKRICSQFIYSCVCGAYLGRSA